MFEAAESYEAMMGRWSRQLAPLFVEFVGVRDGEKVLHAGCGSDPGPSHRSVEDPRHRSFQGIVGYARSHVTDPRVIFELGDAQALSYTDESFDRCMHCRSEHTCCCRGLAARANYFYLQMKLWTDVMDSVFLRSQ